MTDKGAGAREHARLVKEILARCGARHDCRLWANNTGVARAMTHDGMIHFGLKGSADIIGLHRTGTFIAIEVKTGEAVQTKEQVAFQLMVEKFNGRYTVAHTADQAEFWLNFLFPSFGY